MGAIRRSRTTRPPRRAYRLNDRDLRVLRAVGRLVYATIDQLVVLGFFHTPSTCARRLAKLVALLYLAVRAPRIDGPNVYRLTQRGLDLLLGEGLDGTELHLGSRQKHEDLRHTLLGNEFRVLLVAAARARPGFSLKQALSDADLRREAGEEGALPPYVPDLLVELDTPGGVVGLLVEADTGSESVSYFVRTKVDLLRALRVRGQSVWGLPRWRPVVVVPVARRLHALARAIVEAGEGETWLGTDLGTLRERGALGPAFATFAEIAATPNKASIPFARTLDEALTRVP